MLLGDVVGGGAIGGRQISLVELPAEIIVKILQYMSYKEVSAVRRVTRRLNELCAARLNTTFQRLQSQMLVRFQAIKVGKRKKLSYEVHFTLMIYEYSCKAFIQNQ